MARIRALFSRLFRRPAVLPIELEWLKQSLEAYWPAELARLRVSGVPLAAADDDADDDSDDDSSDDDDDSDDADDSDDDDSEDDDSSDDNDSDDGDEDQKKPSFLRRMARRHERRADVEKKRADRLEAENKRLKAGKDGGDDSDDESDEVKQRKADLDQERREFRLEQAVDRLARNGLKVKVDGKDKTVKFADPDDALAQIERSITKGDIDSEELFDDNGRVDRDALKDVLSDLAEDKPHLVAGATNGKRPRGGSDGGKGKGAAKAVDELSIEELDEKVRAKK